MNPGFSSTPGVLISMARFSEVTYHAAQQTVDVGAGMIWDDVYSALELFDVSALGGRVTGIGVAGFTLGGGAVVLSTVYWTVLSHIVFKDTPGSLINMALPSTT